MVSTLRLEDRLDGALNFRSWKARVLNMLEENEHDEYVTKTPTEPTDDSEKKRKIDLTLYL